MTSYPAGGIVPHSTQGTVFYSHDEAKILPETYYNIGNDLYQSLLPKLQTQTPSQEDIWRLYPAFVNLSFSCEIILKLFYENDYGKIVSGHKLYKDLFNKLSDNSKKIISDLTINAMKDHSESDYTNEIIILLSQTVVRILSRQPFFYTVRYYFLPFYIFPGNRKTRRTEVLRVSYA